MCLCVCQRAFLSAPNATHEALIHLNAQTNRDLTSSVRVWYNIYTWYDKGPSIQWLSLFLFEGGCHIKYDGSFIFWVHTQAERSDSELPGDSPRVADLFCRYTASPKCHNSCMRVSSRRIDIANESENGIHSVGYVRRGTINVSKAPRLNKYRVCALWYKIWRCTVRSRV